MELSGDNRLMPSESRMTLKEELHLIIHFLHPSTHQGIELIQALVDLLELTVSLHTGQVLIVEVELSLD